MKNIKSINKCISYINIVLGCIFIFVLDEYIGNRYKSLSLPNRKSIDIMFYLYPMIIFALLDFLINLIFNKLFKLKLNLKGFWEQALFLLYIIVSFTLLTFSSNYANIVDKIVHIMC